MTYGSLPLESVGVVFSKRSRVTQFDSTAGTRTRWQWAELTRVQAFKSVLSCSARAHPVLPEAKWRARDASFFLRLTVVIVSPSESNM